MKRYFIALALICLGLHAQEKKSNKPDKQFITLPAETVMDKIRGGLLGQMLGDLNGLKHEMRYLQDPGNVTDYIPSLPNGAWTDDDTDFEWVYIYKMQKSGMIFLPYDSIRNIWITKINRGIWCSNNYVRRLMDIGMVPPITGSDVFNPWAEFNITGQFLCETYALLCPAMPQTAAKIGLHYTKVAIDNEPAQTTQFFTTMIATAFTEDNLEKILETGKSVLDPNSIILKIYNDVKGWYTQYPENWRETRRLMKEKYLQENYGMRDFNGHELNTGSIIAALLYGKGDFQSTMKMAFNFGWDADCNAATAGTIIGVMKGYRWMMAQDWNITDRYANRSRDNMPMDETITSFADRLIFLFEQINQQNGGNKVISGGDYVYHIPKEEPAMIEKLTSMEETKKLFRQRYEKEIRNGIINGKTREDRARAAYMAICLDMMAEMQKADAAKWQIAKNDLSGYWKIMNNIFNTDNFKNRLVFKEKFIDAGFKAPGDIVKNWDYADPLVWKSLDIIYGK